MTAGLTRITDWATARAASLIDQVQERQEHMPYIGRMLTLQVLVPAIVSAGAWYLWSRSLKLGRYDASLGWRRICSMAGLTCGMILAVFQLVQQMTPSGFGSPSDAYQTRLRYWAIAGMCLSSGGLLISIFGVGIARILMAILMLLAFAWWWFVWGISFITW